MDIKKIVILVSPWAMAVWAAVIAICAATVAFGMMPTSYLYGHWTGDLWSEDHNRYEADSLTYHLKGEPVSLRLCLTVLAAVLGFAFIGSFLVNLFLPVVCLYRCYREQQNLFSFRFWLLGIMVLSNFSVVPGYFAFQERYMLVFLLATALIQLCYIVRWGYAWIKADLHKHHNRDKAVACDSAPVDKTAKES